MEQLSLITEQETITRKCRELFNIVEGVPLNTTKKATPSQAVYLTNIYGVETTLNLIEGTRDLAASLICSKHKDVLSYVLEGMSLNMVYLTAVVGIVSKNEIEFISLLEDIVDTSETDEDSYNKLVELLDDREFCCESENIPQETRVMEKENKKIVSFYDKECMDWNGLHTIKEANLIANKKEDTSELERQFGQEIQQKLIKVVNGKYNFNLLVNKQLFRTKDCIKPHWETEISKIDEEHDLISIYNVGINDDAIFVPKGAYIGFSALEDDSKLLILSDNETDEQYIEEIKNLNSLIKV